MSQVEELERRITAALDRIAKGIEPLGTALDTSAVPKRSWRGRAPSWRMKGWPRRSLEERVKALHEKQDGTIAKLEAQLEDQGATMSKLDGELQRLRARPMTSCASRTRHCAQPMKRGWESRI